MSSKLSLAPVRRNDDGAEASSPGISIEDAAYHTGHDFPGGVPALALRMGINANTLQCKLDPNIATHKLSLREAQDMMSFAGDDRILHALAAARGHVALALGAVSTGQTIGDVMRTVKEFGELLQAVNAAVADERVTLNEMRECERQFAEVMAAGNALMGTLREMMPRAPE